MKYEIRYRPAFSAIFITLDPQEQIAAEAGAMVSMDAELSMTTELSGGFFSALVRKFLGGETLFINVFKNLSSRPLNLVLSQAMIGDIAVVDLTGKTICFQPGAYIAHTSGTRMGVRWAGFASLIAGEGLFRLELSGQGHVFFGGYGGLTEKTIRQEFIVDTSHLVAYEAGIKMKPALSGNLFSSLTSGEGLVNKLTGNGKIYLQSRSVRSLIGFLSPKAR